MDCPRTTCRRTSFQWQLLAPVLERWGCRIEKGLSTFPEQKFRRPLRTLNFWWHILIDGLITNQIALLLPVRGRTEFGKTFGIDCKRFLSSAPTLSPSSLTASPLLPNILLTPGVLLRSPAFSLACSIPAWKGNETAATQATSITIEIN